jgi:exo-beta-1,3-glucanase (GH17 family)
MGCCRVSRRRVSHIPRRRAGAAKIVTATRTRTLVALTATGLWAVCGAAHASGRPLCTDRPAARPALERLRETLAHGRFVAYEPTSLKVVDGKVTPANPAGIRADLEVLRQSFDGLITYDAIHGNEALPAIAAALRFRALIIGVFDPLDEAQVRAASEAAQRFPELVTGISLGNELLFSRRTDPAQIAARITRLRRRLPGTPLSTTEPFHVYLDLGTAAGGSGLLAALDFLLVNVHPLFQPWFRDASDATAAQFVVNVLDELAPLACGPVLVKETGEPTAPADAGLSPGRQGSFYRELRARLPPSSARAFAYFSAFDAPWRAFDALTVPGGAAPAVHPEEAHWGLYDSERRPKPAAHELPPLSLASSPGH